MHSTLFTALLPRIPGSRPAQTDVSLATFIASINSMNKLERDNQPRQAEQWMQTLRLGASIRELNTDLYSPRSHKMQRLSSPLLSRDRDSAPSWDTNPDTCPDWSPPCFPRGESSLKKRSIIRKKKLLVGAKKKYNTSDAHLRALPGGRSQEGSDQSWDPSSLTQSWRRRVETLRGRPQPPGRATSWSPTPWSPARWWGPPSTAMRRSD